MNSKNIARPIEAFVVSFDPQARPRRTADGVYTPPMLADRPSLIVLPFDSIGGGPFERRLADGIAEDLTTDF